MTSNFSALGLEINREWIQELKLIYLNQTVLQDVFKNVWGDKDTYWLAAGRVNHQLGIERYAMGIFGDECIPEESSCVGFGAHYVKKDEEYVLFSINSMKY